MNLFSIFLKGGIVMWPILLCSILSVTIIIDRFLTLRKAKINAPAFMVRIRGYIKKDDIDGALNFCRQEKSSVSHIIKIGLQKFSMGPQRVKEAIENAGRQELIKLEKGLTILASISGIAPLLGFLGTVTGMISAFMIIENLAGAANPSYLAGGIWEALTTTAFGLIIGILALGFYNYFINYIKKLVNDMENVANDIVDLLQDQDKGSTE